MSRADPAAQWTGATKGHAFSGYAANDLIDLDHVVIVDVEASLAIRQVEVGAAQTMIERSDEQFGLYPERLAADAAYGSTEILGWLIYKRGIEPHIPVIDKSQRVEGTLSRAVFAFDHARDLYTFPRGKEPKQYRRQFDTLRASMQEASCVIGRTNADAVRVQ